MCVCWRGDEIEGSSKSPGLLDEDERGFMQVVEVRRHMHGRHTHNGNGLLKNGAPISCWGAQTSLSGGF